MDQPDSSIVVNADHQPVPVQNRAMQYMLVAVLCAISFYVGFVVNQNMNAGNTNSVADTAAPVTTEQEVVQPAITTEVLPVNSVEMAQPASEPEVADNVGNTSGIERFEKFSIDYYRVSPTFGIGPAPKEITLTSQVIQYIGTLLHNDDVTIPAVVREIATKEFSPTIYKLDSKFRHAADYFVDYLGEWYLVCESPSELFESSLANAQKQVQDRWPSATVNLRTEELYGKRVAITCPLYTVVTISPNGELQITESFRGP